MGATKPPHPNKTAELNAITVGLAKELTLQPSGVNHCSAVRYGLEKENVDIVDSRSIGPIKNEKLSVVFFVGGVGWVGREGHYHAESIYARPTTHEQYFSVLRATPALEKRIAHRVVAILHNILLSPCLCVRTG